MTLMLTDSRRLRPPASFDNKGVGVFSKNTLGLGTLNAGLRSGHLECAFDRIVALAGSYKDRHYVLA